MTKVEVLHDYLESGYVILGIPELLRQLPEGATINSTDIQGIVGYIGMVGSEANEAFVNLSQTPIRIGPNMNMKVVFRGIPTSIEWQDNSGQKRMGRDSKIEALGIQPIGADETAPSIFFLGNL